MKKNKLRWVAVIAASAIVASGCASGGAEADSGATYVEALPGDPEHLNPQLVASPTVERVGAAIFDTLVRVTPDMDVIPWLAESYEIEDDGQVVTFHLRQDVTWHDGEPFDAADVKFNLEEVLPLSYGGGPLADAIENVDTPDSHTVVVNMKPFGPILPAFASQFMLPEHIYSGTDFLTNPANTEPVGTGAMMFESLTQGEDVVLVKNQDYWGGDTPVDRVIYAVMPDANTRSIAIQDGTVDLDWSQDPAQISEFVDDPSLEVSSDGAIAQSVMMFFNTREENLADAEVRSLLYRAINRQEIAEVSMSGVGSEPTSILPPDTPWTIDNSEQIRVGSAPDVEEISKALDEAGFPVQNDGLRFTVDISYISSLPVLASAAEIIRSSLADINVGVKLAGADAQVVLDSVYKQSKFDLSLFLTNTGVDPSLSSTRWYECNPDSVASRNPTGICDSTLDDAVAGAANTYDNDEREEHFEVLQTRALELVGAVPLAFSPKLTVYSDENWEGLGESHFHQEWTDWTEIRATN